MWALECPSLNLCFATHNLGQVPYVGRQFSMSFLCFCASYEQGTDCSLFWTSKQPWKIKIVSPSRGEGWQADYPLEEIQVPKVEGSSPVQTYSMCRCHIALGHWDSGSRCKICWYSGCSNNCDLKTLLCLWPRNLMSASNHETVTIYLVNL